MNILFWILRLLMWPVVLLYLLRKSEIRTDRIGSFMAGLWGMLLLLFLGVSFRVSNPFGNEILFYYFRVSVFVFYLLLGVVAYFTNRKSVGLKKWYQGDVW